MVKVKTHTRKTKDGKTVRVRSHTRGKPNNTGKGQKVELRVYSFDELPREVKEKVLDEYRNINVEDIVWADPIIWSFVDKVKQMGFDRVDADSVVWSIFNRGAKFGVDVKDLIASDAFTVVEGDKYVSFGLEPGITKFGVAFQDWPSRGWQGSEIRLQVEEAFDEKTDEDISDSKWVREKEAELWKKLKDLKRASSETHGELEETYSNLVSDEDVMDAIREAELEFTRGGKVWSR